MDENPEPNETLIEVKTGEVAIVEKDPMKPRRLTEVEIQDLLSIIPNVKGAADEISEYNRNSMLDTLREQLKEIIMTPLGISDMKDEILRQFNDALIKPGSVVGVTAAEALGQPITQMALNSFHQSGSSKNVTYGINRIRELIYASKELKNNSCSIYFNNQNMSFDDIITKVRPVITEISVNDLVKGIPDIETTSQIKQDEPWWYGPYRMLVRSDFNANSVLLLDIDVDMLYAYKINMRDISRVIEQDQSVICVYSPMHIGQIHVYPIEKSVTTKIKTEGVVDSKNASMIFLWEAVIPALDKLTISGMIGIQQIYPVEAKVLQIVKDVKPWSQIENGWFLILNPVRMKITGIRPNKLVKLCETAGLKVLKSKSTYIGVQTPNGEDPLEFINNVIKLDKEHEKHYEEQKRHQGARVIRRPPTAIMTASHMLYADSDGSIFKGNVSSLRSLLAHPDIDSTRTYCNNVHEINSVLGIEAARSFLIKEFSDVIGYEGAYINPRHIVLLVDFMVSLGQVNGITFTGISRQPIGALEKASFEKAFDTFKEASGFGEKKDVTGTSASIYVGKRAQIGTGYSDNFMDPSLFKDIEEEINIDPNMKLDIGAFKDAIGEMADLVSGADIMVMEGAEDEMFGGDGPLLPGGLVMPGVNGMPDQRALEQIKGPLIRAPELTQAAIKLNEAPCLVGPTNQLSVKDITKPLAIEALPISGDTTAPLPQIGLVSGTMGLPDFLKEQMGEFTVSPIVSLPQPQPNLSEIGGLVGFGTGFGIGLPPMPPVGTTIQTQTPVEEKSATIMFNLDEFLG